ncbi:helix-hairpin-helix domain-containing protein [Dyadobacter psychrotolerans]|uniref:AraC family transcriptional regulator n=1 Tax=Dyadobacter psychrotolerans TaxID=2541721 RepID=A0A4R5DAN9_9BACT|nr:helix-hairpin-helix domain-containing protein [Dyadobacter psychrotolerans]TDE08524.1 AraC family transcriptional regulator [Dyadobacter psychrotolerans]
MTKEELNPLDVTAAEVKKLRALKIKKSEMHLHKIEVLQKLLDTSKIRAMELFALSEFQSLPSIGIRFAHDLIWMGYYSLQDLKSEDGAKLTDQYELEKGVWTDPCVEDQFRLVVHFANHPNSKLNWWNFTPERKAFREKNGYPSTRPKKPWFESPQYQTGKQIPPAHEATQKDLHKKLKLALAYMTKHPEEKITIAQLADLAHLSQYHFIRCFRSAYELTPLQYLTRLRLKQASLLLKKSDTTIGNIVPQCGFENESAFIRLFKKEFRMTPIAYRKEFGKKK